MNNQLTSENITDFNEITDDPTTGNRERTVVIDNTTGLELNPRIDFKKGIAVIRKFNLETKQAIDRTLIDICTGEEVNPLSARISPPVEVGGCYTFPTFDPPPKQFTTSPLRPSDLAIPPVGG